MIGMEDNLEVGGISNDTLFLAQTINQTTANQTETLEKVLSSFNDRLSKIEEQMAQNNCTRCIDTSLSFKGVSFKMKTFFVIFFVLQLVNLSNVVSFEVIKTIILALL